MQQKILLEKLQLLSSKPILITGAQGMLGNSFKEQLSKYLPDAQVKALSKNELDIRNKEQVLNLASWLNGGWIIHCAAFVNVEGCAQNPTLARETIVEGTKNLLSLAQKAGAQFFYPQSFLIYDGSFELITEETQPNPLSLYGQLKLETEKMILEAMVDTAIIVRMAGFFGGNQRDKNFVGKIIKHMSQLIHEGQKQIKVGDRIWQPTWTDDLALNSLLLMATNSTGIFQMASHGSASFYQLTKEIIQHLNWDELIEIIPVKESEISSNELGRRPAKAELDCHLLKTKGLDYQRPWNTTLKEYLNNSYFDSYRNMSKSNIHSRRELQHEQTSS